MARGQRVVELEQREVWRRPSLGSNAGAYCCLTKESRRFFIAFLAHLSLMYLGASALKASSPRS